MSVGQRRVIRGQSITATRSRHASLPPSPLLLTSGLSLFVQPSYAPRHPSPPLLGSGLSLFVPSRAAASPASFWAFVLVPSHTTPPSIGLVRAFASRPVTHRSFPGIVMGFAARHVTHRCLVLTPDMLLSEFFDVCSDSRFCAYLCVIMFILD